MGVKKGTSVSTVFKRKRSEESGQRKEEKKPSGISTKFNQVDESLVYCCGLPNLPIMTAKKKKRQVGSYPTNSYIFWKKSRKITSTHPLVRTVEIVAAYHLKGKKCETSVVFYGNKYRSIGDRGI